MKPFRLLLLALFAVTLCAPPTAEAQGIRKRLRDRATKRAEQKVERRAEQMTDRAVDKVEDELEDAFRSATEKRMEEIMSSEPKPVELGPIERGDGDADFVSYRQATRLHFPGMTGGVASILNRFGAVDETIRMHDGRKRSDNRETSSIDDAPGARTLSLFHQRKQWSQTTYAELAAAIDGMNPSDGEMPSEDEMPNGGMKDLKLTVDRRGPSGEHRGVPTEQIVLLMEGEYESQQDKGEVHRGKMYIVTDMHVSEAVAGRNLIRITEQAIAQAMGHAFQGTDLGAMLGVWANDPNISGSLKAAAAEMEKVTGFPVETDVYIVQSSLDHTFDVDRVLAGEMADPQNLQAMQGGAPVTGQHTMLKVSTLVGDLTTQPFDRNLLDRPVDYEEIEDERADALRGMSQANRPRRN